MRLNQRTIHQILIAHNEGERRSTIAERFGVDSSTVRYHVEKFEGLYGSTQAVYSLVEPEKKACVHPSLKCLLCGKAQDHIKRRELEKINRLKRAFQLANERLTLHGYEPVNLDAV